MRSGDVDMLVQSEDVDMLVQSGDVDMLPVCVLQIAPLFTLPVDT